MCRFVTLRKTKRLSANCWLKTIMSLWFLRTPPFSSDEESEEEDSDMEEEQPQKHQRGKTQQVRLNQATQLQIRASKASPVQTRKAAARHSFSSIPLQSRGSGGGVTKTTVTKMESDNDDDDDDEWSEVSELQEIDPRQLQSYKDQNGNVDKRNFGKGKLSIFKTASKQFTLLSYWKLCCMHSRFNFKL